MPPKQQDDAGGEPQIRAEHVSSSGFTLCVKQGDICQDASDAIVNAADEAMQHGGGVAGAIVAAGGKEIQVESDEWVAKHGRVLTGSGCAVTGAGSLPCKHVIHVVGPVWSEQLEGETLARGEVVSLDGKGGFTALTEECGNLAVPFWAVAGGYVAEEGDRVKICAGRKPPPKKGMRGEFAARYAAGAKFKAAASDSELLKGAITAALSKADSLSLSSVSLPAISSGVFGFPLAACAEIMVSAAHEFGATAKSVKRVSFTNRNAATVAAFVNVFRSRYGDESVSKEASAAAAGKMLLDGKGREMKGPLLITVDSTGCIISKEPCPPTTVAKQRELKASGFFFHSSGPHQNNWVKGIPPPPELIQAGTFSPGGDWSRGGYGTKSSIPGMEDDQGVAGEGKGGGKKKKKGKGGSSAAAGVRAGDSDDESAAKPAPAAAAAAATAAEPSTKEDVAKRIKAVGKKLRQAEELEKDRAGGKELNVDQVNKVEAIGDMKKEMADLEARLKTM